MAECGMYVDYLADVLQDVKWGFCRSVLFNETPLPDDIIDLVGDYFKACDACLKNRHSQAELHSCDYCNTPTPQTCLTRHPQSHVALEALRKAINLNVEFKFKRYCQVCYWTF